MTEIQENQCAVIAEYMGAKYEELQLFVQPNAGYIWNYPKEQEPDNNWSPWTRSTKELKYLTSLDWLHPVAMKVLNDLPVSEVENDDRVRVGCWQSPNEDGEYIDLFNAVYNAIVFINGKSS